jgi:hypothetical protein
MENYEYILKTTLVSSKNFRRGRKNLDLKKSSKNYNINAPIVEISSTFTGIKIKIFVRYCCEKFGAC